jgi:hypothetical protein
MANISNADPRSFPLDRYLTYTYVPPHELDGSVLHFELQVLSFVLFAKLKLGVVPQKHCLFWVSALNGTIQRRRYSLTSRILRLRMQNPFHHTSWYSTLAS